MNPLNQSKLDISSAVTLSIYFLCMIFAPSSASRNQKKFHSTMPKCGKISAQSTLFHLSAIAKRIICVFSSVSILPARSTRAHCRMVNDRFLPNNSDIGNKAVKQSSGHPCGHIDLQVDTKNTFLRDREVC